MVFFFNRNWIWEKYKIFFHVLAKGAKTEMFSRSRHSVRLSYLWSFNTCTQVDLDFRRGMRKLQKGVLISWSISLSSYKETKPYSRKMIPWKGRRESLGYCSLYVSFLGIKIRQSTVYSPWNVSMCIDFPSL